MTQYNMVNKTLSASKLSKITFSTKNTTNVTLRLSLIIYSDDESNILHRPLLTDRQVASLCKAFAIKSPTNTKFSKTQLSKIIWSGRFLG